MPNSTIDGLTAILGANTDGDADSLALFDDSAGSTKKISPRELLTGSLWPTTLTVTSNITLTGTLTVSSTLTANTFASSGATLTGGTINNMVIGGSTPAAGTFTAVTNSALTSGRVVLASTGGLLADDADLTFSGSTTTAHTLTVSTGNLTVSTGQVVVPVGAVGAPSYTFAGFTGYGIYFNSASGMVFSHNGVNTVGIKTNQLTLPSTSNLEWTSGVITAASDLILARDAANTLNQRNGTTAQELRVTNTFTSLTNNEIGKLEWASNVFRIGTEKGSGGGTARALSLVTDDAVGLSINITQQVAVGGAATSTTTALNTPASTTGVSSVRLPHGSAPTSPVDGDMWTTTAGLFVRINGGTIGPLVA